MRRRQVSLGLAGAALAMSGGAARATEPVDVLLVLCMDASGSIDQAEFELQRRGYAEAVTDPRMLDAILGGPNDAVAIAMVEWGSPKAAATVVPWMHVHDRASAGLLAAAIVAAPRSPQSYNAIGDAIVHSHALIESAPYRARRRVIDVSGDNPDMRSVTPSAKARDEAVASGVTVNALVLPNGGANMPGGHVIEAFEQDVIGGPGSFVMVAEGRRAFAQAIRAKLVREVSGLPGPRRATPA
jgi:hypothetical protein